MDKNSTVQFYGSGSVPLQAENSLEAIISELGNILFQRLAIFFVFTRVSIKAPKIKKSIKNRIELRILPVI
tara:strand:+ start:255 stop:467 length:213 start_codon:yes stop_codon:yes gene_type:complete